MIHVNAVCVHPTRGLAQPCREVAQVEALAAEASLTSWGLRSPHGCSSLPLPQAGCFPGLTLHVPVVPGRHESMDFSLCRVQMEPVVSPAACTHHSSSSLFAWLLLIRLSKHPVGWIMTLVLLGPGSLYPGSPQGREGSLCPLSTPP